jgi:hypothetical protein
MMYLQPTGSTMGKNENWYCWTKYRYWKAYINCFIVGIVSYYLQFFCR